MAVKNEGEAESYVIQARQYRLNHKHFNVFMSINNFGKPIRAVIRIFLGPKYNVHNKNYDSYYRYRNFYELDNFIYNREYKFFLITIAVVINCIYDIIKK